MGTRGFRAARGGGGGSARWGGGVSMPISPSSAFETCTKVAALGCALKSKDEAAMRIAALKLACIVHSFHALGGAGGRLPGWQSVEGSMWSQGRALAVQMLVAIFMPLESSSVPARTTRNPRSGLRWL